MKNSSSPSTSSRILGVRVDALDMEQTVKKADYLINSGGRHRHLAMNAAKLVEARENSERARLFNGASLISADGQAVVWAARLLGMPLPARVAGIDLMDKLVDLAIAKNYGIYLLGATNDVVEQVARQFEDRGARIVGYHDGYWRKTLSDDEMVSRIANSKAQLLFVAVPSPMKEDFIATYLQLLDVPLCVGVGGSFDVVAGIVRRAPTQWQSLGLEWLYRLLQEPSKMFKRYLVGNSKFVFYVLEALRRNRQG